MTTIFGADGRPAQNENRNDNATPGGEESLMTQPTTPPAAPTFTSPTGAHEHVVTQRNAEAIDELVAAVEGQGNLVSDTAARTTANADALDDLAPRVEANAQQVVEANTRLDTAIDTQQAEIRRLQREADQQVHDREVERIRLEAAAAAERARVEAEAARIAAEEAAEREEDRREAKRLKREAKRERAEAEQQRRRDLADHQRARRDAREDAELEMRRERHNREVNGVFEASSVVNNHEADLDGTSTGGGKKLTKEEFLATKFAMNTHEHAKSARNTNGKKFAAICVFLILLSLLTILLASTLGKGCGDSSDDKTDKAIAALIEANKRAEAEKSVAPAPPAPTLPELVAKHQTERAALEALQPGCKDDDCESETGCKVTEKLVNGTKCVFINCPGSPLAAVCDGTTKVEVIEKVRRRSRGGRKAKPAPAPAPKAKKPAAKPKAARRPAGKRTKVCDGWQVELLGSAHPLCAGSRDTAVKRACGPTSASGARPSRMICDTKTGCDQRSDWRPAGCR